MANQFLAFVDKLPNAVKGPKRKSLEERFWANVVFGKGEDDCWNWSGYTNGIGYGYLSVNSRVLKIRANIGAHRISWEIHNGPIPDDLFVCHKCDNPICTNPKHLFLGTNLDNMRDCSLKNRQNGAAKALKGSKNGNAILTEADVRIILASKGSRGVDLARQFGVGKSLITAIRKRRAWRHVQP